MEAKKPIIEGVSLTRIAKRMGLSRSALSQKMNRHEKGNKECEFTPEELAAFVEASREAAEVFIKDVERFAKEYFS